MSDSPEPAPGGEAPAQPGRRFAWWHGLRPLTRRAIRVTGVLTLCVLISGLFAVSTATYTGSLGPHVAEYSTRLNGEIRVDMGPLGALVVSSPLPANVGVDVLVREIPDQLTADGADPVEGLTADLNAYSQFLANPQATIDDAARGLIGDAVGRAVVTLCVLMMIIALGRLAAHGVLREAAKGAWRQPGVPFVAPVLAIVLVVLPMTDLTRSFGSEGRTSPVLADTPLAEARVTGRLATIIDHYGGIVVRAVEDNNEFYAQVEENLVAAYAVDTAPLAPPARPSGVGGTDDSGDDEDGTTDDSDGSDDGGVTEDGDGSDDGGATDAADGTAAPPGTDHEPRSTGTGGARAVDPTGSLPFTDPDADYATFLVISDLHCNVGMAPVIGRAAELGEVDAILNAGDTVMSGTSVESACVNAFADGIDSSFRVVVADGNHDSILTGEQERARGWTVLDGGVVEVAGVRILGDSDPTLTEIGTGTRPERDETVVQMGERLAQQACELRNDDNAVDMLLVHSPHASRPVLHEGCVTMSISGHMHRQIGPLQRGYGVQYVSGSTAGAALGRPTVGPLQSQAAMTVVRWNVTDGIAEHYRLIHAETDRTVSVGPWLNFPLPPEQFVDPDAPIEPDDEETPEDLEEGDPSAPNQNLPEDDETISEEDGD